MNGTVYLIGAGCGRADLITVRGLRLLERCDAVVYDDLMDRALLSAAPADAERIYVGKRQGRHSAAQEEINRTLVRLAREGKTVARLKGGDPFVFGRGGEELLALQAAGVPCEEVPGISSAIAIPAGAGIPVTHRGVSRSVHIVTAHTAAGLPEGLDRLAGLDGTLVFLMGLSRLEELASSLLAAGKDPDTPAAVLSGGCAPHPAAVRGTLADIGKRVREAGVEPPAVIVVGGVAAMKLTAPNGQRPLSGRSVGLTGTRTIQEKLRPLLEERGAAVYSVMESVVEPSTPEWSPEALCGGAPHWLVFTSAHGVEEFFRRVFRDSADLRHFAACRFAVIGPATGEALARRGIQPDLCPEEYTSAALARTLAERVRPGEDVSLLRSAQGAAILPEVLKERGIPVTDVPLYRTRAVPRVARLPELDDLLFASAGGVEAFFRQFGTPPEHIRCAAIGPVTAKALEKRLKRPVLAAAEPSARALAELLCRETEL